MSNRRGSTVRGIALAAVLGLAATSHPARAQGLTYDMKTTGQFEDPRGGQPMVRTFMAGHGQFAGGKSRIDYTESAAPSGPTRAGTYMITNGATRTTWMVDPAKREYAEFNAEELAKTAEDAQKALGGLAKTEMTNINVTSEELGAGESIGGYATVKYRITEGFTMSISVMGQKSQSVSHSTIDLWVTPELDGAMDPVGRAAAGGGGATAALTAEVAKAYTKVRKGVVLRTIITTESTTGAKKSSHIMTTEISNVKRGGVASSVFDVPSGYTKVDALTSIMGGAPGGDTARAGLDAARRALRDLKRRPPA